MNNKWVLIVALYVSLPAYGDSGFTGEIILGESSQKVDSSFVSKGDSKSFGVRVSYLFSDYAALALEYKDFGEAENKYKPPYAPLVWDIDARAINFGIRGYLPISESAAFYSEAGISNWDIDVLATNQVLSMNLDDSGTDHYYRGGFRFAFSEHVFTSIEFTTVRMGLSGADHVVRDVGVVIGYQF